MTTKRLTATVPSIGDAIEALNDLCACLTAEFKNILDLSAELAARDSIRVDSITQVLYCEYSLRRSRANPLQHFDGRTMKIIQDLDMAQKRAVVAKQIQSLRREARNKAQSLLGKRGSLSRGCDRSLTSGHLDTLEILLLLLWRHLRYYSEVRPTGSQIQVSTPHITRLVTSMDVESFREEVPRKLSALLQRLDALNVVNVSRFTRYPR